MQFHCCGVNSKSDYPLLLPVSCCANPGGSLESVLNTCLPAQAYDQGCAYVLSNFLKTAGKTVGGVAIGIAVVEVSWIFKSYIRSNHSVYFNDYISILLFSGCRCNICTLPCKFHQECWKKVTLLNFFPLNLLSILHCCTKHPKIPLIFLVL